MKPRTLLKSVISYRIPVFVYPDGGEEQTAIYIQAVSGGLRQRAHASVLFYADVQGSSDLAINGPFQAGRHLAREFFILLRVLPPSESFIPF